MATRIGTYRGRRGRRNTFYVATQPKDTPAQTARVIVHEYPDPLGSADKAWHTRGSGGARGSVVETPPGSDPTTGVIIIELEVAPAATGTANFGNFDAVFFDYVVQTSAKLEAGRGYVFQKGGNIIAKRPESDNMDPDDPILYDFVESIDTADLTIDFTNNEALDMTVTLIITGRK